MNKHKNLLLSFFSSFEDRFHAIRNEGAFKKFDGAFFNPVRFYFKDLCIFGFVFIFLEVGFRSHNALFIEIAGKQVLLCKDKSLHSWSQFVLLLSKNRSGNNQQKDREDA